MEKQAQACDVTWPAKVASLRVQAKGGSTYQIKIAAEDKLFLWAVDTTSRRQFQSVFTESECASLSGMPLGPTELARMLTDGLQTGSGTASEVTATVGTVKNQLVVDVTWETKYIKKHFSLQAPEKNTTEVDRLEARVAELEARLEDANKLRSWTLQVVNPAYPPEREGVSGHFALLQNHLLIQDTDYKTKLTGVSTSSAGGVLGWIQATFGLPVHVTSIKIAPFPALGWGSICKEGTLLQVQQFSLQDGEWKTLHTLSHHTEEIELPVDSSGVAWRLCGQYVSISKLIFK